MPTLDAIRKSGIVDAAVVTVRYFGGTLLGTGGLVRAYGHAAADALRAAGIVSMQPFRRVELLLTYADYPRIGPLLSRRAVPILASDFGVDVRLSIRLPESEVDAFLTELTELTAGRALSSIEDLFFDGVPIELASEEKN
jgi:putative IMPACT (imprinted ancient) family translation regulator